MSRSSRPSPRPLRLPHLKFDCCVGRVGRVPIDLGLVASIMVIDSGPHLPGAARDFIRRAIRGNRVIPSRWCWFGHHSGITKKHMRMRERFPPFKGASQNEERTEKFGPIFAGLLPESTPAILA